MRIVISGTVGVGKSTASNLLFNKLKEEFKNKKINFLEEETVNSVYLDYYYSSPKDWAFIAQLDFLLVRFKQWLTDEKKRMENKEQEHITIYDRHFLDDYVFAELHSIKKNISNFNSVTYQAVYKELLDKMNDLNSKPDLFFLLTGDFNTIKKRIEKRGRETELETKDTYWKDLFYQYYERDMIKHHFKKNSKNLILIDTNNKTPDQIVDSMVQKIKEYNENNN